MICPNCKKRYSSVCLNCGYDPKTGVAQLSRDDLGMVDPKGPQADIWIGYFPTEAAYERYFAEAEEYEGDMLTGTEATALEFATDANGNRRLADRRFDGATFPDLQLHPPPGTEWILERVYPLFQQRTDDWCLDITCFHGAEVEVIGVPAGKIRISPTRQVVVRSDWRTEFNWETLGLKRLGFFGIVTKKLQAHNVREGVFSLPDPKRNRAHYDEAVRELEILRRAGGVVD